MNTSVYALLSPQDGPPTVALHPDQLLPGVMQLHDGRCFQHARVGRILVEVAVDPLPLSEATLQAVAKVTVESRSRPGKTFESLHCYQGRSI